MSSQSAKRGSETWLVFATLVIGALCFVFLAYAERMAVERGTGFVPVSLSATQVANYRADPLTIHIPADRIDMIADAIHDQEPDADAAARFATVQANLLTPVAWLISPTPSRTPTATPTRTSTVTPSPSATATPADPWISLGYASVGCNTEVTFNTVTARRLRFQLISGGGNDNHVSFYCCGSTGVAFWVNNTWVHVTDQSSALNAGESRETSDVNAAVNRARFNIGCNDKEQSQVQIFYIPLATPTPTMSSLTSLPPRTFTSTLSPTRPLATPTAR